ncbi:hypothetical protein [Pseudoalteromonas sp. ZZD1]|uniref:hypothetical protein n=1 Tax=Pseudoalteromonas sp. ZZD1 TaxID=3139395 RepID=UPI003BA8E7A1
MEEYLKPISLVCAIIVAGLTIYKFFKKSPSEKESPAALTATTPDSVVSRFIALFESHGVKRTQIPPFFGHGLTLFQCSDDEELLKILTPEILKAAADLFAVNLDWLQGATKAIYEVPNFYKSPSECIEYLESLKQLSLENELFTYVITPKTNKNFGMDTYDALVIITEVIGRLNDRPVYRYHLSGTRSVDYWKSKAYFTAQCALLFKYECSPIGKSAETKWINSMIEGSTLLKYDFDDFAGDVDLPIGGTWYVDEMIEKPDSYLENVAPEHNQFGLRSALQQWLELEHYMNCFTTSSSHQQTVQRFEKKLTELGS